MAAKLSRARKKPNPTFARTERNVRFNGETIVSGAKRPLYEALWPFSAFIVIIAFADAPLIPTPDASERRLAACLGLSSSKAGIHLEGQTACDNRRPKSHSRRGCA